MTTSACDPNTDPSAAGIVAKPTRLNLDLMTSAVRSTAPFVDAYVQFLRTITAQAGTLASACCEIPETDCPPKYACTMRWRACLADVRHGEIRVRNTSQHPITYTLDATDFCHGKRSIGIKPTLTPQSVTVAAGQSTAVKVEVTVTEEAAVGQAFESDVRVRGMYDRYIRLVLLVEKCCDEICEFDHGEVPTRIRADNWHRHFQCTELCFERVPQSPPES
jgi:hypothetical protein